MKWIGSSDEGRLSKSVRLKGDEECSVLGNAEFSFTLCFCKYHLPLGWKDGGTVGDEVGSKSDATGQAGHLQSQ